MYEKAARAKEFSNMFAAEAGRHPLSDLL